MPLLPAVAAALLLVVPTVAAASAPADAAWETLEAWARAQGIAPATDDRAPMAGAAETLGPGLAGPGAGAHVALPQGAAAGTFLRFCFATGAGCDLGIAMVADPAPFVPCLVAGAGAVVVAGPPRVAKVSAGTDTIQLTSLDGTLGLPGQVTHPEATFAGTLCTFHLAFPTFTFRLAIGDGALAW